MAILGKYEISIDEKNRIFIPSKIKKNFKGNIIVTIAPEGCIFIFPQDEYDAYVEKCKNSNSKDEKLNILSFISNPILLKMDSAGRIMLPKNMLEYAQIESKGILLGTADKFEMWSIDRWKKIESKFSTEDLDSLKIRF